jgi:hypothetical protein
MTKMVRTYGDWHKRPERKRLSDEDIFIPGGSDGPLARRQLFALGVL